MVVLIFIKQTILKDTEFFIIEIDLFLFSFKVNKTKSALISFTFLNYLNYFSQLYFTIFVLFHYFAVRILSNYILTI